jgi:AcrR family transcriptional regulator
VSKVTQVPAKRATTERRALTHDRLVGAATRVVARRGFHAATVDEIADEAGYSVGALYSNFDGKDDLFLAVFDGHLRWYADRLAEAAASSDQKRAFLDWMRAADDDPDQVLIFIEFWAYAVRRPKLRRSFARRMAEMREALAHALERRAQEGGAELALPAETLALVLLSLGRGLALEQLADPAAIEDSLAELVASLIP